MKVGHTMKPLTRSPLFAMVLLLLSAPSSAQDVFRQGVDYRIEARLDDATDVLRGRARLEYTNNAPEALDTLWFHQYLNAFRPNSAWVSRDLETGRETFQALGPDDHGFERITALAVEGRAVSPVYPFSPDSTVMAVPLPSPLGAGATAVVELEWDARLATEPRRQGRRGRHYNWAHWYPRIAVYSDRGWEYRPHVRQGEFNGEFGRYDVTLDVAADQVLGSTGVPVDGDPGWERAAVAASARPWYRRDHYGEPDPARSLGLLGAGTEPGRKRVRWLAEEVHNFAWSTSPDYVYRGARWDDVAIHLVWEPTSERWDAQTILDLEIASLDWLVGLFGEYPWPQLTVTDRIESGATEYPMLYMTSGGAVFHETAHMYAHGILANNEWRQGWLDEGMASFLDDWFQEDRGRPRVQVWGETERGIVRRQREGRAQPVALPGAEFESFATYGAMTYDMGSLVLRMLRDLVGEQTMRDILRTYYRRHRFTQVTESEFRAVAEEVSGGELDWFFDQWIHTTGWLDYRLGDVSAERTDGAWRVTAEVIREGDAWMPVTIRAGDATRRLESRDRRQTVTLLTGERPDRVVLDPDGLILDVDRTNDEKPL